MNELKAYLEELAPAQRETFAEKCGTSLPYLRQIIAGVRVPKAQLAIEISKQSRGRVSCEDVLPDLDWKYLRESRSRQNGKVKQSATA